MYVKNFQFLLSNVAALAQSVSSASDWSTKSRPATEEEIDEKIRQWSENSNAKIHDVKIRTYELERSQNGMSATVVAIYTILYTSMKWDD